MSLTLGAVADIKRALSVDLLRLDSPIEEGDTETLGEVLVHDFVLLGRVMYQIVKRQRPEIGEDDFLHSLGKSAQYDANRAFQAELVDFFHAWNRPELVEMILTQAAMIEAGAKMAVQEIQTLDLDGLLVSMLQDKMKSVQVLSESLGSQE